VRSAASTRKEPDDTPVPVLSVRAAAVGIGVIAAAGLIVAAPAVLLDWDVWPGVVAVVLLTCALSGGVTIWVTSTTSRRAQSDTARLVARILDRLPADDADPLNRAHRDFIKRRYAFHLVAYSVGAPRYDFAFNFLSLTSIVAALGSSGLSAAAGDGNGGTTRWIVFALGIVVALFTGVVQLVRPAQRATTRYQAANALRRAGWDFALARNDYNPRPPEAPSMPEARGRRRPHGPTGAAATTPAVPSAHADLASLNTFIDEVCRILYAAEQVDETPSDTSGQS
jgi:hypothetical protein